MMIVAITGGIGSGKSSVASYLVNQAQAQYCDTDQLCRDLLVKENAGWRRVVQKWGRLFLDDDGNIDRPLLRQKIFEDSTIRGELENILHPLVKSHVAELKTANMNSVNLLVVEVPLLFEVGWQSHFDKVVTVVTSKEECVKRVMKRDRVSANETEKIIQAQMPMEEKAILSDYVINNSGSWEATCEQVNVLVTHLREISTAT